MHIIPCFHFFMHPNMIQIIHEFIDKSKYNVDEFDLHNGDFFRTKTKLNIYIINPQHHGRDDPVLLA